MNNDNIPPGKPSDLQSPQATNLLYIDDCYLYDALIARNVNSNGTRTLGHIHCFHLTNSEGKQAFVYRFVAGQIRNNAEPPLSARESANLRKIVCQLSKTSGPMLQLFL